MPSLEDWKKFKAVVDHRGVNAAAKAIHSSPGAVSTAVHKMQDELRVTLFTHHPFQTTPDAHRLYDVASCCIEMLEGHAYRARTERGFRFRLGGSAYVMENYMRYVRGTIRSYAGDVKCHVRVVPYTDMVELLRKGQLDIAVGPLRADLPEDIEYIRLMVLSPLLMIPDRSEYTRIRSAEQLFRAGLVSHKLLAPPPDSTLTTAFDHYLRQKQVTWEDRDFYDEVGLIPPAVEEGDGIGLGYDVPSLYRRPRIRPLWLPDIGGMEYGLMWSKAMRESCAQIRRAMQATATRSFRLGRNGKVIAEQRPTAAGN